MPSITIHDLEPSLAHLIRARARADGASLNQTIKRLLEGALGLRPPAPTHRKHFEKFCGMWSKAQAAEFTKATRDFGRVDLKDWR